MADFFQNGLITTVHDLRALEPEKLERLLEQATRNYRLGLVLPVTASDMRAPPFGRIADALEGVGFIDQVAVVLNVAPDLQDYKDTMAKLKPLGSKARLIWADGPRIQRLLNMLIDAGLNLQQPGKGRSVWTAFGYLLDDPRVKAFVLHDCDIVNYERGMLARLCIPLAHPSFDFDFCKAYYPRFTDRLHGRVCRLLVTPLLRALTVCAGHDHFIDYLDSFRYPLAGEFAISTSLARSNRIPCHWGLEIGTLAEVYRNASIKRVCQVELCQQYEHKHQPLSLDDPTRGLQRMGIDITTTVFRTLASMGTKFESGLFTTLRSTYLRAAQDAIRQYHADAVMNGLLFDRHAEEATVEGFAQQIVLAGEAFEEDPIGGQEIPNWARVIAAFPDFPAQIRRAVEEDAEEYA